jgi:hypothetical protein
VLPDPIGDACKLASVRIAIDHDMAELGRSA